MIILDARTRKVLRLIAHDQQFDVTTIYINGSAVFYRKAGEMRFCCNIGSEYWQEVFAHVLAHEAIEKAQSAH